jgi:predicted nucleic acid-binding protein
MTIYAETSAVLRWLFAEEGGEGVRGVLEAASKVATSRLTLIETRRVIHRAERAGRVTSAQAADLRAIFAQATATWAVLELSDEVARRAEVGFPIEPVRTLDAIHLASALFLREALPDLLLVTTDERVRANAQALGFEAR